MSRSHASGRRSRSRRAEASSPRRAKGSAPRTKAATVSRTEVGAPCRTEIAAPHRVKGPAPRGTSIPALRRTDAAARRRVKHTAARRSKRAARRRRETAVLRTPVRNRPLWQAAAVLAALLVVLVSATTFLAPADGTAASRAAIVAMVVVVVLAVGVIAVVAGTARARRPRVTATLDWIQGYELTPQTFIDHPHLDRRRNGEDSLVVRTLRAQVHTLEQALREEQARQIALEAPRHRASVEEDLHRDVSLTLKALARSTSDEENPRHVLARAAAAVERLGAGDTFTRPVLTPVVPLQTAPPMRPRLGTRGETSPEQEPVDAEPAIAPAPEAQAAAEPSSSVSEAEAPTQDLPAQDPADPVMPAPAEPEIVLPVPPLSTGTDDRRGRRWFRRSAA